MKMLHITHSKDIHCIADNIKIVRFLSIWFLWTCLIFNNLLLSLNIVVSHVKKETPDAIHFSVACSRSREISPCLNVLLFVLQSPHVRNGKFFSSMVKTTTFVGPILFNYLLPLIFMKMCFCSVSLFSSDQQ